MKRKYMALLLTVFLLAAVLPAGAAGFGPGQMPDVALEKAPFAPDEIVTFIIEVEGDPVLAGTQAALMGTDYIGTESGIAEELVLLSAHDRILEEMEAVLSEVPEPEFTYTALFNGFSVKAPYGAMDAIRQLEGVASVLVDEEIPVTPYLGNAGTMTHALSSEISGYSGKGQVIAVIDDSFDLNHEFFSTAPAEPTYTKDDITALLSATRLNVSVSANQVYRSEKIPFAYNYATGTADTYITGRSHGTHVAGIAAGSGGPEVEGSPVAGLAPDAQLLLMAASTPDSSALYPSAYLAAVNDAAKLGACVVNCSFGADYLSPLLSPYMETVFTNARNAGIFISVAAGNASLGFYGEQPLTKNIDYAAIGIPGGYSASTTVASADNSAYMEQCSTLTLENSTEVFVSPVTDSFIDSFQNGGPAIVDCGAGADADFTEAIKAAVNGKIALIQRGTTTFAEMEANAQEAGAAGLLIANSAESFFSPVLSELLPTAVTKRSGGVLLRENPDTAVLSVGQLQNVLVEQKENVTISSFSSYGVLENLELKPEITAPGGKIYSALPDDSYGYKSGTSMAAPHITGITALMNEYMDVAYPAVTGVDRVAAIENRLMSTAGVLYYPADEGAAAVPYSPRVQGAGMANAKAAMETPVILAGDSGKSKLNLADKMEGTFTLAFTAQNLSDTPASYDTVSVTVVTDDYEEANGQYYVSGARLLTVEETTAPSSIAVEAESSVPISFTVTLNEAELTENEQIFPNGFFVEGFVRLQDTSGENPEIGMPFMGFYGDWTKATVFDSTQYDEGGSTLMKTSSYAYGTYLYSPVGQSSLCYILGATNDSYYREYIGLSPDSDGYHDELMLNLTPMRTISSLTALIEDAQGEQAVEEQTVGGDYTHINKFFSESDLTINGIDELPEGDYTLTLNGTYSYTTENPTVHTLSLPFYIDTTVPKITAAALHEASLSVTATDNKNILYLYASYPDTSGERQVLTEYFPPEEQGEGLTHTFTLEDAAADMTADEIYVGVVDCARNYYTNTLSSLDGCIQPWIQSMTKLNDVYGLTMCFASLAEVTDCAMALAFYDAEGTLLHIDLDSGITLAEGVDEHSFTGLFDVSTAATIKLFVFDGQETLAPLQTVKHFSLDSAA